MKMNSQSLSDELATRYRATGRAVRTLLCAGLLLLLLSPLAPCAAQDKSVQAAPQASPAAGVAQRVVKEGIAVDFQIRPLEAPQAGTLVEGQDAAVQFKITDTATGSAVSGLHPSVWIDGRDNDAAPDPKQCREKIQSFLQGSMSTRPDFDLNTYYILTLNNEADISVIDPLVGFGTTKLYTLVFLKSPGEDWVQSRDGRRLFVSMPASNAVAVVDTASWKVIENINVGLRPMRLVLQPDEKYLWVSVDSPPGAKSPGGVSVVDTSALKFVKHIPAGEGSREIVVTPDDRFAYVTSQTDGTLSVVDVQRLAEVKKIKTGTRPAALAISPLSKAVYVADETDGTVTVVGGESHEVRGRIQTDPGLAAVRFTPDGRWGFVVNRRAGVVEIFDAATNRRLQAVPVEPEPDQITFSDDYAYVHSLGSENVCMIRLAELGTGKSVPVTRFPGGQLAPGRSAFRPGSDLMATAPEPGTMIVANPADKQVYYYMEGMGAPSGSYQNYGRVPRAVRVLDRSLRETSPGVYSTDLRLDGSGKYDVAFLTDSPRVVNCFELSVKPNPVEHPPLALQVEPLYKEHKLTAGTPTRLRFKVLDGKTEQPNSDLKDLGVLTFLTPGNWTDRQSARSLGGGVYEVEITAPKAGVYYVFVQCRSKGLGYKQLPYQILQAVAAPAAAGATAQSAPHTHAQP
jgi:YVTN family beta-propeller protein